MLAFTPPKGSFTLHVNHRGLLDSFFKNISENIDKVALFRLLDKYKKLPKDVFMTSLQELWLGEKEREQTIQFMESKNLADLEEKFAFFLENEQYTYFKEICKNLEDLWYWEYITFSGSLIRGFDYYDGVIFEMFDNNPDNPRALFGGGRYNGLASVFWVKEDIPAVGMAPGDETMKIFLENWGVLDKLSFEKEVYYFPVLDDALFLDTQKLAKKLRTEWKNILHSLTVKKMWKAMKYADKNNFSHIVIFGEDEKAKGEYIIKDLKKGEEEIFIL